MRPKLDPTGRGVALLSVVGLVIAVLAVNHRGVVAADLRLNDGGVWVTNAKRLLVGHLNYPSRTLDGGVVAASGGVDVSQEARDVVVHEDGGVVNSVDTARQIYAAKAEFPQSLTVLHGGPTVAVVDSAAGRLWALPVAELEHFSAEAEPTLADAPGIRAVVARDGTVHSIDAGGNLRTTRAADGDWETSEDGEFTAYDPAAKPVLTLVGDRLIAYEARGRVLSTPSGSRTLAGDDALVLQEAGPDSDVVVLAGPTALLQVPLDDGAVLRQTVAKGTPARPAVVGTCAYAAWSGSGAYVRQCPGTANDVARVLPDLAASGELVFRVNRDLIVLNDVAGGDVYLPNEGLAKVDDWDAVQAQVDSLDTGGDDNTQSVPRNTRPKRGKDNHAPTANSDDLGVRPGRSSTLPVLFNDTDPDGDVLTAATAATPTLGTVKQIRGGEALQVTVPDGASGEADFTYTASDGRGGEDTETVTVTVRRADENNPPTGRPGSVTLAVGHEVTYNVLADWIDPDGDPLFLDAVADKAGLAVTPRPDGLVTIRDLTDRPRKVTLTVLVGDGGEKPTSGVLTVDVVDGRNHPPVANADHVRVAAGQGVIITPLVNDTDPESDPLRLTKVGPAPADAKVRADSSTGTFHFASEQVGTVYVPYDVTDGPNAAAGVVRVDVVEPDEGGAPVTDDDVALLPAGGSVLTDVLANDDDPGGGVLVVQSVSVPRDLGLAVEVRDHNLLRISAPSGLTGPATFDYTVTNGSGAATGQVTVVPLPPEARPKPPVAGDDAAIVRAGDVVTVPVLADDHSPAGLDLTVKADVDIVTGEDLGEFFVSDDTVRFKAGLEPGRARVTYTVTDTRGNLASADVVVTVRSLKEKNSPPKPEPLTARVVGGSEVVIGVPTDGIDPNGDSVTLVGIRTPPTLGTAGVADGKLRYRAPVGASGTDTFRYAVADRFGAVATGTVQVGIAPPPPINQPPVAVADEVTARLGVELALPVTRNDLDGDGDIVTLTPGSVEPADPTTTTPARAEGSRVWLTTPEQAGTLRYYYDVADGKGGAGRGSLTVEVTPTAPKLPPLARDDIVDPGDVVGKTSVIVPVLANDEDPDGVSDRLAVATDVDGVTIEGGNLRVPLTAERQVVVYTVTDRDELSGKAVVVVPPGGSEAPESPPMLNLDRVPVRVKAGRPVQLALADYVRVRSGRTASLTNERGVRAGPGADGSDLVKDERTLVFTSDADFGGDSSLTFEVTDGTTADDPDGLKAVLTIPIVVAASVNRPPTFQPSQITVEAGGADPTTVDLAPMATDPDPADAGALTFALGRADGVGAELRGSTLTLTAPDETPPGTSARVALTVSDRTNPAVAATLPVTIVATTKPLMTTRDAIVDDAKAGEPSDVDVTDYVTNPFAGEGKPVTLVGRPAVTAGEGSVTATRGTRVSITPAAGFHGQLTVEYTLNDATNRPERQVGGRILLTVRGKPDAPTAVSAESNASRTASVSWTPGAANGAPITSFTVDWVGGSQDCGAVTTCTIASLTNDTPYRFTVAATNEVGTSPPSDPSAEVRPDVSPATPSAPSATYGDRQIALSWPVPPTDGSAVVRYEVEVSPPAGGKGSRETTSPSLTWTGLTNGTAYQFRVRAYSNAREPSDFGPYSAAEVPAGPPGQPAAPRAAANADKSLPPSATVDWSAPDGNGDDALTYEVRQNGGAVVYSGTDTQRTFGLTVGDATHVFEVRATNKAGTSAWSPVSNGVRAFQAPGAPTGVAATATGENNQVRITFTPGPLNGVRPEEVQYFWKANRGEGVVESGGLVTHAQGFPNGQDVQVSVFARATVNGEVANGAASASSAVNAYGPPGVPGVTATGNVNDVTLAWDGRATGNGRAIVETQIETTDGGTQSVAISGTVNQGSGRNQTKQIRARVKDSAGVSGAWSDYRSAATWTDPAETTSHRGGCQAWPDCRYVFVELHRWDPGSTVYCFVAGMQGNDWYRHIRVDGSGYAAPFTQGDAGRGYLADSPSSPIADGLNTVSCRNA